MLCPSLYVEVKKRVKIMDVAEDSADDDEYFDAVEDKPLDIRAITLPQRPKK